MFKNTLIYTFSSLLSAAIPFLLLPILTRYLSAEQYGQIAMFNVFTSALIAIIGLSVTGAASRRYFDKEVKKVELAQYNGNCVLILVISSILTLLLLYLMDTFLAVTLGIPLSWIYIGFISVFFGFMITLRLGQWQVREKPQAYGVLQVINSFLSVTMTLVMITIYEYGSDGRIYAILLTSIILGFISYNSLVRERLITLRYNSSDFKDALKFGIPLLPHVLGGYIIIAADRFIINLELGAKVAGIYMVAINIAVALKMVFISINKAYSPWLFKKLANGDNKVKIVRGTYLYFLFLIIMTFLSYFISPIFLRLIVGEDFYSAAEILPLIIVSQVLFGMYFMVTNYIFYIKKTKYLSYITFISGAINIVLLIYFVPMYGVLGAAYASILGNLVRFIGTWFLSAKVFEMPWLKSLNISCTN